MMGKITALTNEDSAKVAEAIIDATERKENEDSRYRNLDHKRWMRGQDERDKASRSTYLANRLVNSVNLLHFALILLIAYKFLGL